MVMLRAGSVFGSSTFVQSAVSSRERPNEGARSVFLEGKEVGEERSNGRTEAGKQMTEKWMRNFLGFSRIIEKSRLWAKMEP